MISHQKKLLKCESEVEEFAQVMTALGSKLGRSFLQLPPDFGPAHLPRLENFIHHFPKEVPLAIEFRHPAWFEPNAIAQRGFEVLQDSNIATVITDVAGRRDVLHMRLTASEVLVRFVGNSFHPTDQNRVENWADRLGTWKTLGLEKAYFFLHQPDGADVPPLGVMASDAFHAHLGVAIRRPKRLAGGGELDLFG